MPLMDATRNLVNRDRLALMPPGGILINFARGGMVDNPAVLGLHPTIAGRSAAVSRCKAVSLLAP